jgi:hypothetical protein
LKRPAIGDVIEIATPEGLAYAQYTHKHDRPPKYGALLRVLPGIFASRPEEFSELVKQEARFCVFFPLGAAVARQIVSVVGHEEVPEECRPFPLFRAGVKDPATGHVQTWWLWDGEREWRIGKLAPEQRALPLRQVWNDTLLVKRIVEGWSPADEL